MTSIITETIVTTTSSTLLLDTASAIVLLALVAIIAGREIISGAVQDDNPALIWVGRALSVSLIPLTALFAIIVVAYVADVTG